ncbi:ATP dependent DNA ligase region [Trichostrongylus colubriformis]|uniref:ATP dependent DNA ligase region n=1 Tax=Trichostrongylus colubriformis TaxID=6319 RepID=A0AAN8ES10_TRICO
MMSVFLMGVYDEDTKSYRTVTKCGNGHTDDALEAINKKLKDQMIRIDRDYDRLPKWLHCSRSLVPDFVVKDPQAAPIWEITGAEFSKSENHSAGGISIRFPRVTRIRKDKDWKTATNLAELKNLYECSKTKTDLDRSVEDETPLYAKEGMDHGNVEELIDDEKMEDLSKKKAEASDVPSKNSSKRKHGEEEAFKNQQRWKRKN